MRNKNLKIADPDKYDSFTGEMNWNHILPHTRIPILYLITRRGLIYNFLVDLSDNHTFTLLVPARCKIDGGG